MTRRIVAARRILTTLALVALAIVATNTAGAWVVGGERR